MVDWNTSEEPVEVMQETKPKRTPKGKIIIPEGDKIPLDKISEDYVDEFVLYDSQKKVIELLYNFRMMWTEDIADALGYKSIPTLSARLRELYVNRFLDRKLRPLDVRYEDPGNKLYHMLDKAGAIYIRRYFGLEDMSEVNWSRRDAEVKYDYALHTLDIGKAYARLMKVVREKKNKQISVPFAIGDKHLRTRYYKGKERYFSPDMLFKLRLQNKLYGFYVELDRGTMAAIGSYGTDSFDAKVDHYENFRTSTSTYHGMKAMPVVITITTTNDRAMQLASAVKKKQEELNMKGVTYLFTTMAMWMEHDVLDDAIFIDQNYDRNHPKSRKLIDG